MDLLKLNMDRAKSVLDRYPEIHYATIFGSATNNRLTRESDIDLAVAADQLLSEDLYL